MDLLIPLDRAERRPLRDQIYDGLRKAILDRRLPAGARLPSTRALANTLGVARFTVADAFARLTAEGYVEGRHGAGTFVAAATTGPAPPAPDHGDTSDSTAIQSDGRHWSAWACELRDLGVPAELAPSRPFDFRQGMPALDAFPFARWATLRNREARRMAPADWHYGPVAGEPALREAVAAYLARSRAVRRTPAEIVVTSGAQQGLDLLTRLIVRPGDTVVCEDPGYPAAKRVFAAAGARILPIPVDGDGLQVERLEALAAGGAAPRLIYVTPSYQYPTGAVLPLARRLALLAWARRHEVLVIEDDYESEFRYGHRPVEALAGLDAELPGRGVVAYVGTFSKVIYPALRLGYLALPADLVRPVVSAKAVSDRHSSRLDQRTVAAFIAGGEFERHLGRMRRLYATRRATALAALSSECDPFVRRDPATTAAGLHLLVGFATALPERVLVERAAAAGVHVDPAGPCYATPPPWPKVMLGYAALPEAAILEGIRRIGAILRRG